jgi:hypothetical protein
MTERKRTKEQDEFEDTKGLFFFDIRILIAPLESSNSSCPFVLFLSVIVLSVLRYTDSDCLFGIFKLFMSFCPFFFWSLCCLFFFDIRILIAPQRGNQNPYIEEEQTTQ